MTEEFFLWSTSPRSGVFYNRGFFRTSTFFGLAAPNVLESPLLEDFRGMTAEQRSYPFLLALFYYPPATIASTNLQRKGMGAWRQNKHGQKGSMGLPGGLLHCGRVEEHALVVISSGSVLDAARTQPQRTEISPVISRRSSPPCR